MTDRDENSEAATKGLTNRVSPTEDTSPQAAINRLDRFVELMEATNAIERERSYGRDPSTELVEAAKPWTGKSSIEELRGLAESLATEAEFYQCSEGGKYLSLVAVNYWQCHQRGHSAENAMMVRRTIAELRPKLLAAIRHEESDQSANPERTDNTKPVEKEGSSGDETNSLSLLQAVTMSPMALGAQVLAQKLDGIKLPPLEVPTWKQNGATLSPKPASAELLQDFIDLANEIVTRIEENAEGAWWEEVESLTARLETIYKKIDGLEEGFSPPLRIITVYADRTEDGIDPQRRSFALGKDSLASCVFFWADCEAATGGMTCIWRIDKKGKQGFFPNDPEKPCKILRTWIRHMQRRLDRIETAPISPVILPPGVDAEAVESRVAKLEKETKIIGKRTRPKLTAKQKLKEQRINFIRPRRENGETWRGITEAYLAKYPDDEWGESFYPHDAAGKWYRSNSD